jgi:hypothetical protein
LQTIRQQLQLRKTAELLAKLLQQRNYAEAVNLYKQMISMEMAADQIYMVSKKWSKDSNLLEEFYRACIQSLKDRELKEMIYSVNRGND